MMSESNIMSSASALQRIKSRHGLNVSVAGATSSYILMCKLKKALLNDFTWKMSRKLLNEQERPEVSHLVVTNKLVQRLDRLPGVTLKALYDTLQSRGVWPMVRELDQPMTKLMRPNYTNTEV